MKTPARDAFAQQINNAIIAMGGQGEVVVDISTMPEIADFSCAVAFKEAKILKRSPAVIAQAVVDAIGNQLTDVGTISATAGYVNVRLSNTALVTASAQEYQPTKQGKILLDFGGPNIAKPMHVGHLRSLVIGDSLSRILSLQGYEVTKDIHLGDWGFQMGLLLAWQNETHDRPETIEDLERQYPQAAARAKVDADFNEKAWKSSQDLQNEVHGVEAWKHMIALSLTSVKDDLSLLGVEFDLMLGESDSHHKISHMKSLLSQYIVESEGAEIIETHHSGTLVLRNAHGVDLYASTDLATLLLRQNYTKIIYVVDERQGQYFDKLFEVAHRLTDAELIHAGFGTVNGPDNTPFKTRAGGVPSLSSLLHAAKTKAAERNATVDSDRVGVAAIKYGDLSNARKTCYPFDLDKATSFEGRTGPYLLYQVVRINSILEGNDINLDAVELEIEDGYGREVMWQLSQFSERIDKAAKDLEPSILADYAYKLAKSFSQYYSNGPPIREKSNRLKLASTVATRLKTLLNLLGIETVSRM